MNGIKIIQWAAAEAERLLRPLGDRWSHTAAVAERAKDVAAAANGLDPDILVAAAGRPVPLRTLVDDLWEDPPPTASGTVRTFVSELDFKTSLGADDQDKLTYRHVTEGTGARVDSSTGKLDWTPRRPGNYEFVVNVTDDGIPFPTGSKKKCYN